MQTTPNVAKLSYSVREAAAATSISRTTLYCLINEGKLATRKVGGRTLIPAASLHRLIEGEAA